MKNKLLPLIAVSASLLTLGNSHAVTLLASFDMDNGTGAATQPDGPAPVSGPAGVPTVWTKVTSGGITPGENGISFQNYSGSGFLDSRGSFNDLASDFVYQLNTNSGGDGVGNWLVSGLTVGELYQMDFVMADGTGFGAANTYDSVYSVYDGNPGNNGSNVGSVNLLDSALLLPGGQYDGTWTEGVDFVTLNFTANATTMYGLYSSNDASHHTGIGAVQVTVIPEPSSVALLALGGVALILRRRK
jgi:hypothetical protein